MDWRICALLSAVFAALTAIFAKIGVRDINSNLATAIRVAVILFITWGIVLFTGVTNQIRQVTAHNWLFLLLSGAATGLSWLFYFHALQIGEASKVVPIDKFSVVISMMLAFLILKEPASMQTIIGGLFITIGTFVLIL